MRSAGISQVELIVVLVVIAALGVTAWRLEVHGETVGYARAVAEYATRDNAKLVETERERDKLLAERDLREKQHETEVAALDLEGQRKLKEIENAKDAFVSDVVAGRIRLFNPHVGRSCDGERPEGPSRATASVGDGAAGSELRDETALSLFLVGEATRADKVVVQLTACQRELLADRVACNATAAPAPP